VALFRLKGEASKGFITLVTQDASVAQYPSDVPALTGTGEAVSSLPSRGAVAVQLAECAVLLLRGSAAAILLSPALLVVFLLAG
jgi:hypothetical protein